VNAAVGKPLQHARYRSSGRRKRLTLAGVFEVVVAISATVASVAAPLVGGVEGTNLAIVSAVQGLILALGWRRRSLQRRAES